MNWLYSAHLNIAGDHVSYREILGNLFGLASALGGMRRRVWAWPIGIVGNALLFSVFAWTSIGATRHGPLLGQAGRQVFFVVMSVYGWRRWATRKALAADSPVVTPRWATPKERAAYLAAGALGVAACFVIFRAIGAGFHVPGWWYYLADAWIFVGSIVATFAMARGWVDFWLCWLGPVRRCVGQGRTG